MGHRRECGAWDAFPGSGHTSETRLSSQFRTPSPHTKPPKCLRSQVFHYFLFCLCFTLKHPVLFEARMLKRSHLVLLLLLSHPAVSTPLNSQLDTHDFDPMSGSLRVKHWRRQRTLAQTRLLHPSALCCWQATLTHSHMTPRGSL